MTTQPQTEKEIFEKFKHLYNHGIGFNNVLKSAIHEAYEAGKNSLEFSTVNDSDVEKITKQATLAEAQRVKEAFESWATEYLKHFDYREEWLHEYNLSWLNEAVMKTEFEQALKARHAPER